MSLAIKVENLGKQYRLGQIGSGTISHDLNRWWAQLRGKEDPYARIGTANDRTQKAGSDYVWALNDINFEVEQGDAVGIIGRNGAGKSTLLKILSRTTLPTTGSVKMKGRIASLLEVGTGFHPEMTGRENIYQNGAILGMTRHEIKRKFDEIVEFSGCDAYIDTPVKRYSSGMYVRLAFAVAAHLESEILIVDEVLAVGDAEFQKKCLGKMSDVAKGEGRTVLFVSHNMGAVRELCNKGIVLENGTIGFKGNLIESISRYGDSNDGESMVKFDTGPLRFVKVEQVNKNLLISGGYFIDNGDIDIPNFGFSVSDQFGNPVFGANPVMYKVEERGKYKEGNFSVEIINPLLIDGRYTMSIWFGNSYDNYLSKRDCLVFEISDMCSIKNINLTHLGSYRPNIIWNLK
jgi:lipopolysaccharide transport system ATP-binding protein